MACTFIEFFAACKDRLTDGQLRCLNPKSFYFKLVDGYCGLDIENERVWVSVLVGGMADAWELRRIFLNADMKQIGWGCRIGSPMYAIARYYKAKIEDSGDKYPDGAPVMRCIVDTRQTRRLEKNRVKSQALT